jgi:hypothetical protein
MKRTGIVLAFLATALLAGAGGYLVGFRQGWRLSPLVETPVRGAQSLALMRGLEKGNINAVKTSFESDIDNGLLWWSDVESFPAYPILPEISGDPYMRDNVGYLRRLASYRREHESPLRRPEVVNGMLDSIRKSDPAMADQLAASRGDIDARMAEMVKKYGQ